MILTWWLPLPSGDLSALERWAIFITAIAAGMVAVGAIVKRMRSTYLRIRGWVREGIRRADALDKLVQHELHPNSGGSLHDTVHATAARVDRLEESLSTLAESQKMMWPAIEAVARAKPPKHEETNV